MRKKADDKIVNYFAEKVKQLRELSGLSQRELAAAADIQKSHVGLIENGGCLPGIDVILKICGVLKCQLTDLLPAPPDVKYKLTRNKVEGSKRRDKVITSNVVMKYRDINHKYEFSRNVV